MQIHARWLLGTYQPKYLQKYMCIIISKHRQADIRKMFCDVMTSRHDVMTSCKHKNDNIFRLIEPENFGNKKRIISLSLLQAEIEYSQFLTSWHDVMTWRHHANTKLTTLSNSATQSIIGTKKNYISSTSTSWDRKNKFGSVMPWRRSQCHAVGLNQNLSTVSCEWDLGLWENGTFSWSKNSVDFRMVL